MGQNQVILKHQKFTFPPANGRASGPVLTSLFLFVPDHSAAWSWLEGGNVDRHEATWRQFGFGQMSVESLWLFTGMLLDNSR